MARIVNQLCFLLVFCAATLAQNDCTTFNVYSNSSSDCTDCMTLQDALATLIDSWETNTTLSDCVDLFLNAGEHVVFEPVSISRSNESNDSVSLSLLGDRDAVITCSQFSTYSLHSINIENLTAVTLDGISVKGCARPMRIERVKTVTITNSHFSAFSAGVLDVYNCLHVTVYKCNFTDNNATALIQDPYRGNVGGIAIGIRETPFNDTTTIHISHSCFIGNRADPVEVDEITASDLFIRRIFTGRGGGIGIFMEENHTVTASIHDCYFERNFADTFGGGLYIVLDGAVSNHSAKVKQSTFVNNWTGTAGGGSYIGYFVPLQTGPIHSTAIAGCTFIGNEAEFGGGCYIFPGLGVGGHYQVSFKNCSFQKNFAVEYGAALGLLSLSFFDAHVLFNPYFVEDCEFIQNSGSRGGALSIFNSPVLMSGHNDFINNSGPGLRIIGATLELDGVLEFIGNDAEINDGGALYMTSYAQVSLHSDAEMNFMGNNGSIGSAIVVEVPFVISGFTRLLFNPLCFLRYYADQTLSPLNWTEVILNFTDNSALVGPAIYINQLDLCSWYTLEEPYFDESLILSWPFADYSNNLNLGHHPENMRRTDLFVQTPPTTLQVITTNISSFPGQEVELRCSGYDELDRPTSTIVRVNDLEFIPDTATKTSNNSGSQGPNFQPIMYSFDPNLRVFQPNTQSHSTLYTVNTENFAVSNESIVLSLFDEYSTQVDTFQQLVSFTAEQCPPGYVLRRNVMHMRCECNTVNNEFLVHCDEKLEALILTPHIWSTIVTDSNGAFLLEGYHCPVGYCRTIHSTSLGNHTYSSVYYLRNANGQCSCNRSGILCGNCPYNQGVRVLTNLCATCANYFGFLIAILALVDIVVAVGITLLPFPIPVWAYPCLFYLQIAPYITDNFPITFSTIQRPLYYITSALALYFPYDFCLFKSMPALLSYLFRYIPLFTVVPTVAIVLLVRHKKFRPVDWYGVWNLVLLMYTQIAHTSFSILNCPSIGKFGRRWYINGEVGCLTGAHIPLAILALVVLVTAALLIPFVVYVSAGEKIPKAPALPRWLRYLVEPVTHPFKEKVRWWGAMELFRRLVLLVFTTTFPNQIIAPAYVLMLFGTVYLFVQPYKWKAANIIEAVLVVNVLLLLFTPLDVAILEILLTVQSSQVKKLVYNELTCPVPVNGLTALTVLLIPVYYFPFILLLSGIIASGVYWAWKCYKQRKSEEGSADYELFETRRAKSFAVTEIHLSIFDSVSSKV